MKRFDIRPVAEADGTRLAGLLSMLGYPSEAAAVSTRLRTMSGQSGHAAFVATMDGEVVGMISACVLPVYHRDTPSGWITSLVVDEAHRGRGIGGRLVATAEAWLAENGAASVAVTSNISRNDAHGFYRDAGYEQTGLRFGRSLTQDRKT